MAWGPRGICKLSWGSSHKFRSISFHILKFHALVFPKLTWPRKYQESKICGFSLSLPLSQLFSATLTNERHFSSVSNLWRKLAQEYKNWQVPNQGIIWGLPRPWGKVSDERCFISTRSKLVTRLIPSHPSTFLHLRIRIQKRWEVGTLLHLFKLQNEDWLPFWQGVKSDKLEGWDGGMALKLGDIMDIFYEVELNPWLHIFTNKYIKYIHNKLEILGFASI